MLAIVPAVGWSAAASAVILAVAGITKLVVDAFGGVQDQVRKAQGQLSDDLGRQTTSLRSELADSERRCVDRIAVAVAASDAKCERQLSEQADRHDADMDTLRAQVAKVRRPRA